MEKQQLQYPVEQSKNILDGDAHASVNQVTVKGYTVGGQDYELDEPMILTDVNGRTNARLVSTDFSLHDESHVNVMVNTQTGEIKSATNSGEEIVLKLDVELNERQERVA